MRPTLTGNQIDEYRLEAMLGEGGMASVYRAIDVRLNRYVAIKVIQTSFRDNSTYIMRFEREAQAIAQLEHPNIITLYRFGDKDGLLYIAMQYIDGADLATVIDSFRQDDTYIDLNDVIRLAHEIGGALDYAHSKGVIHRDIKPHNIMINQQNRAIVTDFGLALLTELGTQGEIFGSPHYIAPEQAISSAGAVPQSDLYAFAVVLYEMLTNVVPFTAETRSMLR
ncbi:MAG TPA: serine/threonine-protein kinase [Phototrophicaceae bacterium]|jgi:serine/threonine protein kinase|nr:serine/threonine-protein kinase [Phototrophicaceae bacterium]